MIATFLGGGEKLRCWGGGGEASTLQNLIEPLTATSTTTVVKIRCEKTVFKWTMVHARSIDLPYLILEAYFMTFKTLQHCWNDFSVCVEVNLKNRFHLSSSSRRPKGLIIRATFSSNLQRNIVALQVEKRCCTYYRPPQTLSRNKILLLQVEAACCSKCAKDILKAWSCFRYGGNPGILGK